MNAMGMMTGTMVALAIGFCWGTMCDNFWLWFCLGLAMAPAFGLMWSQVFAED